MADRIMSFGKRSRSLEEVLFTQAGVSNSNSDVFIDVLLSQFVNKSCYWMSSSNRKSKVVSLKEKSNQDDGHDTVGRLMGTDW